MVYLGSHYLILHIINIKTLKSVFTFLPNFPAHGGLQAGEVFSLLLMPKPQTFKYRQLSSPLAGTVAGSIRTGKQKDSALFAG